MKRGADPWLVSTYSTRERDELERRALRTLILASGGCGLALGLMLWTFTGNGDPELAGVIRLVNGAIAIGAGICALVCWCVLRRLDSMRERELELFMRAHRDDR
jgi:hypothetical protein